MKGIVNFEESSERVRSDGYVAINTKSEIMGAGLSRMQARDASVERGYHTPLILPG